MTEGLEIYENFVEAQMTDNDAVIGPLYAYDLL